MDLSIVIPALNERDNLERLIPAVWDVVRRLEIAGEIVVVDGPSTDGTAEVAERLGAKVVRQRERGYGGALIEGFAAAGGAHVLTMDGDLSHPANVIHDLWARREEGELLIASRYVPGGGATAGAFRRALSVILNVVYRIVLRLPVRDLSSGFRLYRREALAGLRLESRDFDVQEEILVRGIQRGWGIVEVPFRYMPREAGSSHVRLMQFGWAYLKTLVRLWRLRRAGQTA